jgi:hypothetical protein
MVADTASRHADSRPALDLVSQEAIAERAQTCPDEPGHSAGPIREGSIEKAPGEGRGAPEAILWAALSLAPDEGISVPGLMDATGMGRRWIYYRLRELSNTGLVAQTQRGNWRTTEPGGDSR